jgi:biotin synthase
VDWNLLAEAVIGGRAATRDEALSMVQAPEDDLLALLHGAFLVRRHYFGRDVHLHVIDNAKSGLCTEDCAFCSQSAVATTEIPEYGLQTVDTIVEGARKAKQCGAVRYCIVASGRGPVDAELDRICDAVGRIRAGSDIQICTSLGLLTDAQAARLAVAGVNRYNHNLETSRANYGAICTAHTWQERVATIRRAKAAGMEICCGGLIGLGESDGDRVDLALSIRELGVDSIPVNFLDPRPGTPLEGRARLSPSECLRVLAMFRFVCPDREIRVAGGREACIRSLQPLALWPANSMFTEGYLTTPGQGWERDQAMLADAGFRVGHWVSA